MFEYFKANNVFLTVISLLCKIVCREKMQRKIIWSHQSMTLLLKFRDKKKYIHKTVERTFILDQIIPKTLAIAINAASIFFCPLLSIRTAFDSSCTLQHFRYGTYPCTWVFFLNFDMNRMQRNSVEKFSFDVLPLRGCRRARKSKWMADMWFHSMWWLIA